MKATNQIIENLKGEKFEIETYFSQQFNGRGSWYILCEVTFKGNKRTFRHYTTDSCFIDKIFDMKEDFATFDMIQNEYKEKAFSYLEEDILEWVEIVNKEM